tara:strand:+ start:384 stop:644 length:261 start_codon:yes stop_codon:yes gene_type:complete
MKATFKTIKNKNDNPTLADAQKYVGGWVELVRLNDGVLIINEEGKLKDLDLNPEASKLFSDTHGHTDYICGPAIYIPKNVPSEWHS